MNGSNKKIKEKSIQYISNEYRMISNIMKILMVGENKEIRSNIDIKIGKAKLQQSKFMKHDNCCMNSLRKTSFTEIGECFYK